MGNVLFTQRGFEEYLYWQKIDRKVLEKINNLIKDIDRNGLSKGIGKPELLKYKKQWSRRINQEDRLVYKLDVNGNLVIISCLGHYDD